MIFEDSRPLADVSKLIQSWELGSYFAEKQNSLLLANLTVPAWQIYKGERLTPKNKQECYANK